MVGLAVRRAVETSGPPAGTFSLLFDSNRSVGKALVADPRIKAVGFTGSREAGTTLMRIAAGRPEPIPVYAEMSSINPVLLLPEALAMRGAGIGRDLASAMTLDGGQFCTNPGLVLAIEGTGHAEFLDALTEAVGASPAATMLTRGIAESYGNAVERLAMHEKVTHRATGRAGSPVQTRAGLFTASGQTFLTHRDLQEEVFGAATLVVTCAGIAEMEQILHAIEGQLTISVHAEGVDLALAGRLLPLIERKAGRIVFNGFGTGVEVAHAMVHGGPYPATSDSRTTSVGTLAINRFLRPVSYQAAPDAVLPAVLKDRSTALVARR